MSLRIENDDRARSYRISTQIADEYGVKLESLQMLLRTDCGKKRKICEVIEMAIESLEKDIEKVTA